MSLDHDEVPQPRCSGLVYDDVHKDTNHCGMGIKTSSGCFVVGGLIDWIDQQQMCERNCGTEFLELQYPNLLPNS